MAGIIKMGVAYRIARLKGVAQVHSGLQDSNFDILTVTHSLDLFFFDEI